MSTASGKIWVGAAPIDYIAGGHGRFILGAEANASSTLTIHDGTSLASSEIDMWGDASETETVRSNGVSSSVIFGGDRTCTSSAATRSGQAHPISPSTRGAGDDTLLLTGAAATTVHGATTAVAGTMHVESLSNTGSFVYDGGLKAAWLDLGGGQNTVFAGGAAETVSENGGSLVVTDAASATGTQVISIATGSTSAFQFWGGGNQATITLGSGSALIQAGAGNKTLTGGAGTTTVDLSKALDTTLDLNGAINIFGFMPVKASASISDVLSSSVVGGNLVVSLGDGATATFHGITDPSHTGIHFG